MYICSENFRMTKVTERILFTEFGVLFHQNMGPKFKKVHAGTLPNIIQSGVISIHSYVSPNTFPWTMRPLDNVRGHTGRGRINTAPKTPGTEL